MKTPVNEHKDLNINTLWHPHQCRLRRSGNMIVVSYLLAMKISRAAAFRTD